MRETKLSHSLALWTLVYLLAFLELINSSDWPYCPPDEALCRVP